MEVLLTETFKTTKIYVMYNGVEYLVIRREEGDGYFIKEWEIVCDQGELPDGEIRAKLIEWAKNYLAE